MDETITFILTAAQKNVEGPRQNIPFSKEKEKRRASIIVWKIIKKKFSRKWINNEAL